MIFAHPEYLINFFILPLLILIYLFRYRIQQKKLKKILGKQVKFLVARISYQKRHLKFIFYALAVASFLLALSRPQRLGEEVELENKGVQIVLAIDISQSMLSEDIQPNRLYFMKKELGSLLDLFRGHQIALVAFAGNAVLISPFTNDLSILKLYLRDLSTDYISSQGTDFFQAFKRSEEIFSRLDTQDDQDVTKALIVASDGEDHEGGEEKILKEMVEKGIRIFTLSVGTKEGGVIPLKGKNDNLEGYKKDLKGKVIVTTLKTEALKEFAKIGKGSYYHIDYSGKAINNLAQDIRKLKQSVLETGVFRNNVEYFQIFLFLGLLLSLIELLIGDRKKIEVKNEIS